MLLLRVTILLPLKLVWWLAQSIWLNMMDVVGFVSFYQKRKPLPTHGNAAFAEEKELKGLGHYRPEGWLVGVHGNKRLFTAAESCAIGMAPRRSGKSQTAIAQLKELAARPNKADVIVADAAGDLLRETRADYEAAGYQVRVINFIDPAASEIYDPLTFLRPRLIYDFDRQIDQLVQLIMPDDAHTKEAHFQEFARILFAGMLSYLMKEDPDNATLYNAAAYLTTDVNRRNTLFSKMRNSTDPIVQQAVSAFNEAGDKEKGSFSTTMTRKTKVWLRPSVRALTETGEVDALGHLERGWSWDDVFRGDIPTITYIRTGLGTDEGAAARLILGNAINTRRYMWNEEGVPGKRDLRILVDEAVTLGNCQAIVDATNELGKAGVFVMMWFLSMRDVFQTYPNAKTLINNCDIFVFGGGKEMDFYEDVSRMIGEKTIENMGFSESDHGESHSRNEQARRVVKADELRRMPFSDMVAVLGSIAVKAQKPFRITKDGRMEHL